MIRIERVVDDDDAAIIGITSDDRIPTNESGTNVERSPLDEPDESGYFQRLEIFVDLVTYTHTLDSENTTHAAAIDIGANNTLTIVTTTGETAVYHARLEFERFHVLFELNAELQSVYRAAPVSTHGMRLVRVPTWITTSHYQQLIEMTQY